MCGGTEAPLSFSLRSEAFASLFFSIHTVGISAKETARDLYPAFLFQGLNSEFMNNAELDLCAGPICAVRADAMCKFCTGMLS